MNNVPQSKISENCPQIQFEVIYFHQIFDSPIFQTLQLFLRWISDKFWTLKPYIGIAGPYFLIFRNPDFEDNEILNPIL